MLDKISLSKRGEINGDYWALHYEELSGLCKSHGIVRIVITRRLRQAEKVARVGKQEMYRKFWLGNQLKSGHLEDQGGDGRMRS